MPTHSIMLFHRDKQWPYFTICRGNMVRVDLLSFPWQNIVLQGILNQAISNFGSVGIAVQIHKYSSSLGSLYTALYRYNAVNCLTNIYKIRPKARPLGRGMGCLLWTQHLMDIRPQSLQLYRQYLAILDRVITALDCIKYYIYLLLTNKTNVLRNPDARDVWCFFSMIFISTQR